MWGHARAEGWTHLGHACAEGGDACRGLGHVCAQPGRTWDMCAENWDVATCVEG